MKRKFPRIKRKVLIAGFVLLLILILGAAYALHILPSAGTLSHALEPKAAPGAVTLIGRAADSLSTPLNSPLIADFSASPQDYITPRAIQFLDLSRGGPGTWHWDFGDNTSSELQHPVHEYAAPGIYNVSLTVTRGDGAQRTVTVPDILFPESTTPHDILLDTYRQGVLTKGSSITLVSGSDNAFVTINNARIPVPNGSVIKLRTNRDSDGEVTIRYGSVLQFKSPDATIFINGSPVATGASGDCNIAGFRYPHANLTFSIVPTMGEIRQFLIDDVAIRAGQENSYIAIHKDSTDLRDDCTLLSSPAYYEGSAVSVSLSTPLLAAFDYGPPSEGNAPMNVSFRDRSGGEPAGWHWEFGDGSVSSEKNPVHQYTVPGSYTVSLRVTRGEQVDTKTVTDAIVVSPPGLTADFNAAPLSGPAPLRVQFTDNSTGSPRSWSWGVGGAPGNYMTADGTTYSTTDNTIPAINDTNPVITFLNPGIYSVWMSVGNIYGSNDITKTGYITVTDPYMVPTQNIYVKTGKRGYIRKDSSVRFVIGDTPATIGMNGGFRELPKGSTIVIVAGRDQSGDILVESGRVLKFSFPDMELYIDGDFVQAGRIDSIYVPYMTKFETALIYYLPPESARTQFVINGYNVLEDLDNAWIRIDNLGMNPNGGLSLVSTDNSTYIDGAAYQTVHDWVVQ